MNNFILIVAAIIALIILIVLFIVFYNDIKELIGGESDSDSNIEIPIWKDDRELPKQEDRVLPESPQLPPDQTPVVPSGKPAETTQYKDIVDSGATVITLPNTPTSPEIDVVNKPIMNTSGEVVKVAEYSFVADEKSSVINLGPVGIITTGYDMNKELTSRSVQLENLPKDKLEKRLAEIKKRQSMLNNLKYDPVTGKLVDLDNEIQILTEETKVISVFINVINKKIKEEQLAAEAEAKRLAAEAEAKRIAAEKAAQEKLLEEARQAQIAADVKKLKEQLVAIEKEIAIIQNKNRPGLMAGLSYNDQQQLKKLQQQRLSIRKQLGWN